MEKDKIWPLLFPKPRTDDHQIWHGWWGRGLYYFAAQWHFGDVCKV